MLIYLHGFLSAPASRKAKILGAEMRRLGRAQSYMVPALPLDPARAIEAIETVISLAQSEPVCLIGSSLGGYYATYLAEKHKLRAVLVNPAVRPYQLLQNYLGPQRNLYSGEEFVVTHEHLAALRALDVEEISWPERYLLLVETGDEILDYREAVEKFRAAKQVVIQGGDHSFTRFEEYIPLILEFAAEDLLCSAKL
jgi:predicted esterase YcpF (UPF0227 family)